MTANPPPSVPLGRSDLLVTTVGLGARSIGQDAVEAAAVVHRALNHGIRYFDTAPVYGNGLSEESLGAALAVVDRERFVLSTKVGFLLRTPTVAARISHGLVETFTGGDLGRRAVAGRVRRLAARAATGGVARARGRTAAESAEDRAAAERENDRPAAGVPVCDFSYDGVMRSVQESLVRLGLNRIDLALIHDPDLHHGQAMRSGYRALAALRAEGTIRALGVGMNDAAPLARFAEEGEFDAFLVAGRYSLLDQSAADALFQVCAKRGVSIILGGVFNGGLLADPLGAAEYNYRPAPRGRMEQARKFKVVCDQFGVPLKAAALQFASAHPAVTTMLLGASTVDELDENMMLLRHPIPEGLWRELVVQRMLPGDLPFPAGA